MEGKKRPNPEETLIRNLNRRESLLRRLQRDNSPVPSIAIKDSFMKFLIREYDSLRQEDIADFNRKIFILLNRAASLVLKRQDTAPVTSMYSKSGGLTGEYSINNIDIEDFLKNVKGIIELCKEYKVHLKSITGMQTRLGLPNVDKLRNLLAWCNEKEVELKSVTGMQTGRGVPDISKLEGLISWCNEKEVELKSVTGMQTGRGIPDISKLEGLVSWCNKNDVDLKSITGRFTSLGIPSIEELEKDSNIL